MWFKRSLKVQNGTIWNHRSLIVFSDSPYQKLPPEPFHIVPFRSYVPRPYFHVSHASYGNILYLERECPESWYSSSKNQKTQLIQQSLFQHNLDLRRELDVHMHIFPLNPSSFSLHQLLLNQESWSISDHICYTYLAILPWNSFFRSKSTKIMNFRKLKERFV